SYTDVWYGDASYGQYGYYEESDTAKTNLKYYTNGNMTKPEYETLYNNMLESVYKNKGFYIGRYEMGIKVVTNINDAKTYSRIDASREYVSTATNANNQKPTIEGMTLPISKANAIPYNRITQSQAQMLAEKLGKEVDYSNVRTSIMFGVQWDAVCVFVEKYDKNNTATTKSNWITNINECKKWGNHKDSTFNMKQGSFHSESANTNSVSWNNYSNKTTAGEWLCTTGASDQNSSLNIYDLGGNLFEWTLERYNSSNQPCTHRGGSYSNNIPTNARYYVRQTIEGYYDMSSRAALYIK
ncbi:MAG: hypothetical protein HFJ17_01960, partial [Clostridia bacterium]|nr:hypothetical protein [Clostridia bacterium]